MGWGHGMGPAGWVLAAVAWLLFLLAVLAVVTWLFPGETAGRRVEGPTSLEVLDLRLARGEIGLGDYRAMRDVIIRGAPRPRDGAPGGPGDAAPAGDPDRGPRARGPDA